MQSPFSQVKSDCSQSVEIVEAEMISIDVLLTIWSDEVSSFDSISSFDASVTVLNSDSSELCGSVMAIDSVVVVSFVQFLSKKKRIKNKIAKV